MVAPDRDRSGASNSLTLDMPIRVVQLDADTWRVHGTPTDCVHLALTGMFDDRDEPDMVVSGINNAANLGDDVIYSGTVSAAMEGRFLGLPAVAVSLVTRDHDPQHFETAARAAVQIVARLASDPLPADTILNVNVPDLPWDEVTGFEATRPVSYTHLDVYKRQVEKRGMTTPQAARLIAQWAGVAESAIGYAGLKDRHAVTRQRFSVWIPKKISPDVATLQSDDLQVLAADWHARKLPRGALSGNRFVLVLSLIHI